MGVVGGRLAVSGLCMAVDARSIGVVRLVDVAVAAHGIVVGQLPEIVVVERCAEPTSGVVAAGGCTICGETCGDVIWHTATQGGGALPGSNVAAIAVGGQVA